MGRQIIIYGAKSFPTPADLQRYIERGVFAEDRGRFDYSQDRDANVIVLSSDGKAYGHFEIASKVKPSPEEHRKYRTAKAIYLVNEPTILYETPVSLMPIGIRVFQAGTYVTPQQFRQICKLAGRIRECKYFPEIRLPEELPVRKYPEGATKRILVNSYERNPAAVEACKAHYGSRCQACGIDLGKRYGEIGEGLIHVHHLRQMADVGEQYEVDPVADLRPVCPNCHAIIHRRSPPLTIEELKLLIN